MGILVELRRILGMEIKDALEIFTDDDTIILKKYKPVLTCDVTGEVSGDNMVLAHGNIVLSKAGTTQLLEQLEDHDG